MKFLHTMIRVKDVKAAMFFFCEGLGLQQIRRHDYPEGKFSLIFLATAEGEPEIELTHNWDNEAEYSCGRNFGHVAFQVDDIYASCERLEKLGIQILRPPRDGRMAFVRSPDKISVELLQKGSALEPKEPWKSGANIGEW